MVIIIMSSLILTKWDVEDAVYVPAGIVSNLQNYHLPGIRFLYNCYQNKLRGAILNHDIDMNFPVQVSAFLTALKKEIHVGYPALIICSKNRFLRWLYHLKIYGDFVVHFPKGRIIGDIKEGIIMTSFHETKMLQNLIKKKFSFIVVEEFDLVSHKRTIKRLQGKFHIGLTTHNFIKEPNQKVFYEMVNWTNPGVLGRFSQFCKDYQEHMQNFSWPYEKYCHRLTWTFCDTFTRPTVEEEKEYIKRIELWAKQEKIGIHLSTSKKRKNNKTQPKGTQEEMQSNSFTSSDSSNDIVETLGKKTNIRNKKRKVTPNTHVKGKSGKYIKRKDDNEINFRRTRGIEKKLVANNLDFDCNFESNSQERFSNLINQPRNVNGDFLCSSGSSEFLSNTLQSKKVKRKRNLPLLSNSSSAEGSQSDEDNKVLLSLLKTEKLDEGNEHCVNKNKKTQSQLDLCTMLNQSVDEFEKSLEENQSNENYDVLMSIISSKKNPSGNLKKLDSSEMGKSENEGSKKLKIDKEKYKVENLNENSIDSDFYEKFQPKLVKPEFKEQILSLLSSINSDDCDI